MINVFKVEHTKDEKIKRIPEIIMKSIPYPMLLIFEFEEKVQLWTAHQRINQNDESKNILDKFISNDCETDTTWFDVSKMNMTNFYALYSAMVDCISVHNAQSVVQTENLTGAEARELTGKLEEIENQIITFLPELTEKGNLDIMNIIQTPIRGQELQIGNRVILQ